MITITVDGIVWRRIDVPHNAVESWSYNGDKPIPIHPQVPPLWVYLTVNGEWVAFGATVAMPLEVHTREEAMRAALAIYRVETAMLGYTI